jgi:hypothetical protein
MIVLNVCKFENIKLEVVFTLRSIFFFRLRTSGASYNYRNPIKCINEMLKKNSQ